MAELLRDQPYLVAGAVILLAALFALRFRFRRRDDGTPEARPGRRERYRDAADVERARRRVRLQMILALFAILGFTLIAIVNSF
jgi:hypothetical protein